MRRRQRFTTASSPGDSPAAASARLADHPRSRVTGYWWPKAVPIPAHSSTYATVSSGRGSWYSQYSGTYNWVDSGDEPGSNKLGVPDWAQGCAFFDRSTLGDWFVVTAPNGISLPMPQTDIGPNPSTGRKIDISSHMAEAFGYTPRNFPTDGLFTWVPAAPPAGMEHLTPKQQAIQWAKDARNGGFPLPNGPGGDIPKPLPKDNLPLLILLLMMLSKGKLLMADDARDASVVEAKRSAQRRWSRAEHDPAGTRHRRDALRYGPGTDGHRDGCDARSDHHCRDRRHWRLRRLGEYSSPAVERIRATNDIADQHAQHRKARQPRIGRRGRAAAIDLQQGRAGAAQVARVTERGVVAATEDVVADAIRSADSASGREAAKRNRGIRL